MRHSILLIVSLTWVVASMPENLPAEPIDTKQIDSFVNEYTLAVARLDVSEIDVDAVNRWATQAIAPEDRQAISDELGISGAQAHDWARKFRQAGGKAIWVLLTLEPFPYGWPVVAVVPIEHGADMPSLKRLLGEVAPGAQIVEAHDAVVMGRGSLEWLKAVQPAPRPQLMEALSAADRGQVQIALIPSDDSRKVLESMSPALPDGQSGAVLAKDIRWAAAAIRLPPDLSIQAVVQTPDQKSAAEVNQAIKSLVTLWRRPQRGTENQVFDRLINAAADLASGMQVRADKLVIQLDSKQAGALTHHMIGGLAIAHEQALRRRSAANIRQILTGCMMYANNRVKDRQLPDTLSELLQAEDMSLQVLVNPRHPRQKIGYVYVKPPEGLNGVPDNRMVIYEEFEKFDGGINAGFADGHVEWIDSQARFDELLAATKKAAANPARK